MPLTRVARSQRVRDGATTAMTLVRPEASDAAVGEATKSNSDANRWILSRVSGRTLSIPRRARETVATDTPAAWATPLMVLPKLPAPGHEVPRLCAATLA